MRRLFTLMVLLVGLSIATTYGQIYKYIGLDDGLSSRNVYAVQQAEGGFMWFLTDNGIDRYDGSEVNRYTINFDKVKFTEYSSSRFIHDATNDALWLVTGSGRIIRYNKRNNKFEMLYAPNVQYKRSDIMRCAASPIDEEGNIWIIVGDQAFRYNTHTLKGQEIQLRGADNSMTFAAIAPIGYSTFYIGAKGGVYRATVKDNVMDIIPIECMMGQGINVNTIYYYTDQGALLIGTEDAGIVVYKEHTGEVIHHKNLLPDVRVTKIIPY